MWSHSQSAKYFFAAWVAFGVSSVIGLVLLPLSARAQGDFSMTVTPPLFQLSVAPGNIWKSSITVVNTNAYDITVYARPVDFAPTGEEGRGEFLKPMSDLNGSTSPDALSGWIAVSREGFVVPRDQTLTIPFTVAVPENAPPGGHYAAIMVTNQAGDPEKGTINVASAIASLVFLSVAGDVEEVGVIRDFYPDKVFNTTPEASFTLRFENKGNVHLKPVGNIVITNMWGRPRGTIEIGGKNEFGNVLPGSVRKFNFTWRGDDTELDIGRYKAITTLSFGSEGRQNISRTISFWVVPVVPLLKIMGGLGIMLFFAIWGAKRYIRHAVELASRQSGVPMVPLAPESKQPPSMPVPATKVTLSTLVAPLRPRAIDLRMGTLPLPDIEPEEERTFVERYWFLAAFTVVAAISVFWVNTFFEDAFTYERDYEITILKDDGETSTIASTTDATIHEETE